MKSTTLVVSLMLCAAVALAKDVKVRVAWTRTFPNSSLGIMPDNLGNIAATGTENTNIIALLLNTHGKEIARQTVPLPGIVSAVADSSGRIFVTGNEWRSRSVSCAAFAPSLSRLLWAEQKDLSDASQPPSAFAGIAAMIADDHGSGYVFGDCNAGFFEAEFRGDDSGLKNIWHSFGDPYRPRSAVTAVASPSRKEIYFIVRSVALFHYFFVTIQKYTPATQDLITFGTTPPMFGGFSIPNAAACDSKGNLIIAGWHSDDRAGLYRRGRCMTMKMDPDFNLVWMALHGPLDQGIGVGLNIAYAVAVDKSDNVVITGDVGTVKYSADGHELWAAPEFANTLGLDHLGNVLFSRQIGRENAPAEIEITKLNSADGTLRWQMPFHDGSAYDNSAAGLMIDHDGDVYFAAVNGEQTTIVKLTEHGQDNDE